MYQGSAANQRSQRANPITRQPCVIILLLIIGLICPAANRALAGTVYAWGDGYYGELGDGLYGYINIPVTTVGITNVRTAAGGSDHTVALKTDGTVWAWGYNGDGELGDGSTTNSSVPVEVGGLSNVTAVACGGEHSLALKTDGTVWAWGDNQSGQLGNGTHSTSAPYGSAIPVEVSGLSNVTAIAGSGVYELALKSDGTVWAWGDNSAGELGDGSTNSSDVPVKVSGLTNVAAIAGGQYDGLALKTDGTVWAWGENQYGQLGDGTSVSSSVPVKVSGLAGVTSIACGGADDLAIGSDGTVWAWGFNGKGELGDGTTTSHNVPVEVGGLSGISAIAGGFEHSLAVKADGTVQAWGNNQFGELGNGMIASASAPLAIGNFTGVRAVAAGSGDSVALKTDGTVWAWGINAEGELGVGSTISSNMPAEVTGLSSITAIAAGYAHNLALETDGTVRAWGDNNFGELGEGKSAISTRPVQVSGLSNVMAIAAGGYFSLALNRDGTVWAWGKNDFGQLGNGTTTSSGMPIEVSGLANVTAVAAGAVHGLALKSDGTVWAWGMNTSGELGNGSTSNTTVPVQVGGLSSVTAIAAGEYDSFALKADGSLWVWGNNAIGELGIGTTNNISTVPVAVSALSGVRAVTGGGFHTLAVKADGTVWAWGENENGQLGVGTFSDSVPYGSSVPVEVSGLSAAAAIAGGDLHSLAVVGDVTGPVTTASLSGPAGQNGWDTGPASVTLTASDPDDSPSTLVTFYSLDGGAQQTYTAPFTGSGDDKHTLSFFSRDPSGNQETPQSLTIPIDSAPPTLSFGALSPAANAAGWNNSAVTVAFTTADSVSGVASSTPASPLSFTAEGKDQTQSVKVTDNAGNSATFTSPAVDIDLTPPVTTLSFSGPTGADSSSFTGPVQVKLSASDKLSGVSATYYTLDSGVKQTYTQPFSITADGKHTITFWTMDAAGNVETVNNQTALVDTSIPAITISAPVNQTSYTLNQVVNASYSAADTADGIVSVTGPVPSGSPVDTHSVGTKTFTVKASDTAGNSSQASVSYTVSYGVKLLYDPTTAASPGATVPISLQLVDASGANVSSANIPLQAVSISAAGSPALPGTGTGLAFTFEPALGGTGGYAFILSDKDLPAGMYNLNFSAGSDPTVHQAAFTTTGPTATIPAGISMVSVPFANSGDLAALFGVQVFPDGSADVATYDPVSSRYLLYPHLPGPDGKSGLPGRGYWVEESVPTKAQSIVSANPSPLDVTLLPGWNMIGDPYAASLETGSLQVELSSAAGSTPANQFISEPAAVSAGIIAGSIWTYDTAGKQYVAATTLAPFEGYWIYIDPIQTAGKPVTLRFTPPGYPVVPASR